MVLKTNILRLTLPVLALLFSTMLSAAPTKEAGKELFLNNCASCHNKNMKDDMTGPALGGVEERWSAFPRKDLYSWIRNSQAFLATGHPRAVEVWGKWKPTIMTSFPALTDEQMESLLLYVKNPGVPGPKVIDTGGDAVADKSSSAPYFIGFAVLLFLLSFAMNKILSNLNNVARTKDGLNTESRTFGQWLTSHGTIAFLTFMLILLGGWKMVDNATRMGREQNYQPDQPIKFSHKTHAGIQKIDCQYCHDSARRSKHSGIPGTNTCMNCHAAIVKGSRYGTAEISKIYASTGYDPIAKKYIENYDQKSDAEVEAVYKKWIGQSYMDEKKITSLDEAGKIQVENQWKGIYASLTGPNDSKVQGPIEWTRIHNLADHVYFNHAQHVTVGKVACEKCHGQVEKMEVVAQASSLSMGWCINCHRETKVQFEDNAYYKQFERYHAEIKSGKREKVTVEDIGGLECQKCHY
jgi:mono/diheme cytochrome c family protein